MLSWIIYLLVMAGTLYIAAIYASTEVVFLFLVELVFYLTDLALLLYQWRKVEVRLEFPMPAAEKGQEVPVELVVSNQGIFPIGSETVSIKYHTLGSEKSRNLKFILFGRAKGEICFSNKLKSAHSGSYYFETAVLKLYDPLHLLFVRKKIALHERLDIMPEIYQTEVAISEAVRHFIGDSDVYDSVHSGDDASEPFGIREFRAGDKLKDIHWKLSAKEDEWVVRENSAPLACAVILFIDFAAERKQWEQRMDAILSLAASISFALVEKRCPHYVVWFRKDIKELARMRVDSEESLYLFLTSIFGEASLGEKQDLKDVYQEQFKGENFLTDICVNMDLQVILRGDVIGSCNSAQMEESLRELVLQV